VIEEHKKDESKRVLQKRLAKQLTIFVHGEEEYNKAIETTEKLFAQQHAPADALTAEDLEAMEGIVKVEIAKDKLANGVDIISLLAETGIFPSKGEARKMIQNGGVSINRNKVSNIQENITSSLLLHEKYLLVQKGKRNYYLLIAS
jgi:tyrosyl-tRNA synthetase